MTKNNTSVYEMYLDGIYQVTGSIKMLAEHIGKSRKTVDGMIHQGNNKKYSFKRIGKYAQIYALYNKETYVMFGTIEQLSAATGMQIKQLEWFRTPSAEKRGGNYQVIKIEGEFEVVKKKKHVFQVKIYEFKRGTDIHTGTQKELTELTGIPQNNLDLYSTFVGTRYLKIRAENKKTSEVIYGTLDDVAEVTNLKRDTIRLRMNQNDGDSRDYTFTDTGESIVELLREDKPGVTKPKSEYMSVEPVYVSERQPMSEYAKQLFEHTTRGLRGGA